MQGRKKPKQHERDEQEALIQWMRLQHPQELLVHIPNELVRSCAQARRSWLSGLCPGFPDLMLMLAKGGFNGLLIELKRPLRGDSRKGVVSAKQKEIIAHLNSRGFMAIVAYGWIEARDAIVKYMELT